MINMIYSMDHYSSGFASSMPVNNAVSSSSVCEVLFCLLNFKRMLFFAVMRGVLVLAINNDLTRIH